MTRAQYLQTRETQRLVATLVRELPIDDYLAAIADAEKAGPVQDPKMWAEGHPQLVADRALANALLALQRAIA